MNKYVIKGLNLIKNIGEKLQYLPSINRRMNRSLKLSLLEESTIASDFLDFPPMGKEAIDWVDVELCESPLGYFYSKLFNSFYYLPISFLKNDDKIYIALKNDCEGLFELQDNLYAGFERKENKVTIVYADMRGTVASASVSSLYCAALILIYRQVFFSIMTSFHGNVEVPIGDSLLGIFEKPKDGLRACLKILPYILRNDLKVGIGITSGNDFLQNSQGRPIIGRDTNLAVRLSEKIGRLSGYKSVKVEDVFTKHKYYLCSSVDTGVWIADIEGQTIFQSIFKNLSTEIENNDLRLIEYLKEENVKGDFLKFWEEIGYKNGVIYAIVPRNILHVPVGGINK